MLGVTTFTSPGMMIACGLAFAADAFSTMEEMSMRKTGRRGIEQGLCSLAAIASIALLGCGDDGPAFPGGMTKAAQGALPMLGFTPTSSRAPALGPRALPAVGEPVVDQYFTALFAFQCHVPGSSDDCPPSSRGTSATSTASAP